MKKIWKIMALSLVLILFTAMAATAADDPLKVDVPVEVKVEGAFLESKQPFTIELKGITTDAPMPEGTEEGSDTYTHDVEGADTVTFSMEFPSAGVYNYTIRQAIDEEKKVPGWTYDEAVYNLTVYVVRDKEFTLYTQTYLQKVEAEGADPVDTDEEGAKLETVEFTNELAYQDLIIDKTVSTYSTSGKTTSVFKIVAMYEDTEVYNDVVGLTFDAAGSKAAYIIQKLPVGAEVTVTEVYSGAAYTVSTSSEVSLTLPEEEPGVAEFVNDYDNTLTQGSGIVNEFTYTGDGWAVDNTGDNSGYPVVEPMVQ